MRFTPFSFRSPAKGISLYVVVFALAVFFVTGPGFCQTGSPGFGSTAQAATKAREAGKTAEALQLYKKSVELKPDWAEGWWYLGTMQYDTDQFAAAIPAFGAVTKLAPQVSAAWNYLGLCEFETADYNSAKNDLEKGLAAGEAGGEENGRGARAYLTLLRKSPAGVEKKPALLCPDIA